MRCRICGSEDLEVIFRNDKCPKYSHKYLTKEQLANDSFVDISASRCRKCDTIQVPEDFPGEEYVADYQRNISFSKSAVEHVEKMADKLSAFRVKNFFEVGCGNGLFSEAMLRRKVKVTAFEPSKAASNAARARGVEVHNRFFEPNIPASFSGYDAFALRFVLEHIPSPVHFLESVKDRCVDGAVGLIEVPDTQKQIMQKRWFEFFREHTIYFTPQTLVSVISRAGFEVLEMESTLNGEFLSVIVRKPTKDRFDWSKERMKDDVSCMIEPDKKTWAWGASGAGITLLAGCGLDSSKIGFIIDSDKNKWGFFASGSRIMIVPPEKIQDSGPDNIIIMTPAYESEIKKQIRSLGFKGKIGVLWPEPKWLKD
jgi:SAM-dependent methyltransferase